jgi:hypothetical protein
MEAVCPGFWFAERTSKFGRRLRWDDGCHPAVKETERKIEKAVFSTGEGKECIKPTMALTSGL